MEVAGGVALLQALSKFSLPKTLTQPHVLLEKTWTYSGWQTVLVKSFKQRHVQPNGNCRVSLSASVGREDSHQGQRNSGARQTFATRM